MTDSGSTSNSDEKIRIAAGTATGAATGAGIWGLTLSAVNFIGFTATGITSGSTAASMMSAAAVANGGGVASGSAVAILQSIGAVGLTASIGPCLIAGGAAIGGAVMLAKSNVFKKADDEGDESAASANNAEGEKIWVLAEISLETEKPVAQFVSDEGEARSAFSSSSATSKVLFDPEKKIALEYAWDHSLMSYEDVIGCAS
ncbi:Interferon-induced 6/27 [Plasmopara halstedii]|uniref:Interferon-induced 6/27 n=1 Tax=Plasmopara halstedii TaxID=4781 RepID=A0A0P1B5T8_PLAHL|nr:Interferon-induced 6/27 [Plasmopara halstedii]CEG49039.1 Interferon-induced 6/27 [Plasmopara halstedii]|eukprot:XP_024585408.1 Interferon-induced 6/27 [Plasmopara halstedii]